MKHVFRTRAFLCCALACGLAAPGFAAEKKVERRALTVCGQRLELMTADEVKALGFPWVDVPDDKNAATYYIKGANALHAIKDKVSWDAWSDQHIHAERHDWDDAMTELATHLDAAKPALDFYRKGATMQLCQLPYHKSEMLAGMLLLSLGKTRDACRLLASEARRFEAKGKFNEAVDNYIAIVRIGNHYGRGRCLIDNLVGMVCVAIGTRGAFTGICRHDYPPDELRRLLAALTELRSGLPNPVHAMKCEKAFGPGTVDDIMRFGLSSITTMPLTEPARRLSPLEIRARYILFPDRTIKKDMAACYDRRIRAAKEPYHKAAARVSDKKLLAEVKPWNVIAHMLLPALGRARIEAEKCRANVDGLRLAAALKIYQKRTGAYPKALAELTAKKLLKELPTDPFSGKPYLYKVENAEFAVYSVGDNLKDDGGKLGRENGFLDVGFASKLPPLETYKPKKEPQ